MVEQILRDEELNKINPYYQDGNAYPYFYNMVIKGKPLYYYLDEMYKKNSIDGFMDKGYQFIVENEKEIRNQML